MRADCPFCSIVRGDTEASILHEDETALAFLDYRPITPGHLLVVPRVHASHLADLDEESGGHLFSLAMRLAAALRRSGLRCDGVVLFLSDGVAAGQEVPHVHLHVFPRFPGDGFGRRFPSGRTLSDRAELEAVAAQIRKALDERR